MDVSVIVPFRNAGNTIRGCIDALRAQSYRRGEVEIVLVDHGSTDSSARVAKTFPALTLLNQPDGGIYAARNRGAAASSGKLLVFTEADCAAHPEWLSQHFNAIAKTGASVSVGRVAPAGATLLLSALVDYEDTKDQWNFDAGYWKQCFGRPKNLALSRSRFDSHGPFDEVVRGGDTLLVQRVARETGCAEITYCPGAVVVQQGINGFPASLRQRFQDSYFMTILKSSHSAPVGMTDKWRVVRETARRHRYGPLRSILLIYAVATGLAAWKLGQVAAAAPAGAGRGKSTR